MKKIFSVIFCLLVTCSTVKADFAEHYNSAEQYLSQYQYSSAIAEFRNALRINYQDNSARIGLINAYLARGTYAANKDKNWAAAANDYRAALFYLKYYPISNQDIQNSAQAIATGTENLNRCLGVLNFNTSPQSRFNKAKELRLNGLFPEAGYEFEQALADSNLRKDSYEQIGDIMKVLGNDEKSSENYQKAVSLNPNSAGLRLKYARVLDRLGKNDVAVNEYNYALANGGGDPEILYALERIQRQKLAESPNDANNLTNLAAILQKENKYDEALQYYTQAGQIDPKNVTTRLNLGTLYQQRKSYDAAIEAYDSILFLYPDNVQANLYKAQCLAALGQNDKAMESFKKVISLDPTNSVAKTEILDVLKSSMTPAQVMAYLNQNYTGDKNNAINDVYNYAIELHKQQKFDDAIAYYTEILKVKTDNPEIYVNLAIAYKQKNDNANARRVLEQAKLRFPTNKQVLSNLQAMNQEAVAGKLDDASKLYNSNDYQKALNAYLSIQPPTFDSLSGAAAAYKGLKRDTEALEYYKKAYSLKADGTIAFYIGSIYSDKQNWESAKIYLQKAITANPNNADVKDLYKYVSEQLETKIVDKGIDFYDKNNYTQALEIFNKVLTSNPKNAYALYYKGLISDAQKKYSVAIGYYQKAIQYDKTLTTIYYLLAIDYDSLSQFKYALANYKKYVAVTTESNEYKTYSQSRIKELHKYE